MPIQAFWGKAIADGQNRVYRIGQKMDSQNASLHQANLFGTDLYDHHTLPTVLEHIEQSRGKAIKQAVCDRGYRG